MYADFISIQNIWKSKVNNTKRIQKKTAILIDRIYALTHKDEYAQNFIATKLLNRGKIASRVVVQIQLGQGYGYQINIVSIIWFVTAEGCFT